MTAAADPGGAEQLGSPWWEKILRGNRTDFLAESLRDVARLASLGYGAGVRGRELAYRRGWLKSRKLPQPTICIGNITAGGTGKTPLVIRLVGDLLKKGLRPAVLLRGYKRENVSREPLLVRDPKKILASVADAGDEAMELAHRLEGACVGVGADRYAVGKFILKRQPVDCFVLDDGFQHHRLERDINLITMDVSDPWGGGALLPAGLLRESPDALKRADAIILTRTGSVGPDRLIVLRAEIAMRMRENSCLLESRHDPIALVGLDGSPSRPVSELRGKRIISVCGIGNPASFESSLVELGAVLVNTLRLPDHQGDPAAVWDWIGRHRKEDEPVVMTEKDSMRWMVDHARPKSLSGVFALRMELTLSSGREHWENLIELIERLVHVG